MAKIVVDGSRCIRGGQRERPGLENRVRGSAGGRGTLA